jgi:hypothetical protein
MPESASMDCSLREQGAVVKNHTASIEMDRGQKNLEVLGFE